MKRLPAVITMSVCSIVVAVAWLLTVEIWCDAAGWRQHGRARSGAESAGGDAAARSKVRSARLRPTTRKRRPAPESREDLGLDEAQGYVVGRIVMCGGREPVPDASVRLALIDDTGSAWYVSDGAGDDGRFALEIPRDTFVSANVEVESPRGSGHRVVEVASPFTGIRNLGEVELGAFRTVWFSVLAPNGDPIADATVRAEPETKRNEDSGADGTGSIELPLEQATLRVVAFGYEPAEVVVPPFEDSVMVKPKPATTLTVHVTTIAGDLNAAATSLTTYVEFKEAPCDVMPDDARWKEIGNSTPDWATSGQLGFTKSPDVKLTFVKPGTNLVLFAREGSIDREARETVRLGNGEHRHVELVLKGDYRRFHGLITGPRNQPVKDAIVRATLSGLTAATDEQGRFDFGAIWNAPFNLEVSSPRYALWRAGPTRAPARGESLIVKLEPGLPLTVTVVDGDDKPVADASVYALDRHARTGKDGQVVLEHLPPDSMRVSAMFGIRASAIREAGSPAVTVKIDTLHR